MSLSTTIIYNQRNIDGLYSLFSEGIRSKYSMEDLKRELKFAETHKIKIISWKYISVNLPPFTEKGKKGYLTLNIILEADGTVINRTLNVSMVATGHRYVFDDWIFSSLHKIDLI